MTTKTHVTKRDAEKVLAAVKRTHAAYLHGTNGPTLERDWDWLGTGAAPWAIVWEEGPDGWTHSFPEGGVNEELYHLALDALPPDDARKLATADAVELPDTLWTEPITGWALAIYPT